MSDRVVTLCAIAFIFESAQSAAAENPIVRELLRREPYPGIVLDFAYVHEFDTRAEGELQGLGGITMMVRDDGNRKQEGFRRVKDGRERVRLVYESPSRNVQASISPGADYVEMESGSHSWWVGTKDPRIVDLVPASPRDLDVRWTFAKLLDFARELRPTSVDPDGVQVWRHLYVSYGTKDDEVLWAETETSGWKTRLERETVRPVGRGGDPPRFAHALTVRMSGRDRGEYVRLKFDVERVRFVESIDPLEFELEGLDLPEGIQVRSLDRGLGRWEDGRFIFESAFKKPDGAWVPGDGSAGRQPADAIAGRSTGWSTRSLVAVFTAAIGSILALFYLATKSPT